MLSLNAEREFVAERSKPAPKPPKKQPSVERSLAWTGVRKRIESWVHSPLVTAWALAIGITAFAAIILLRPSVRFQQNKERKPIEIAVKDSQATKNQDSVPAEATVENKTIDVASEKEMPDSSEKPINVGSTDKELPSESPDLVKSVVKLPEAPVPAPPTNPANTVLAAPVIPVVPLPPKLSVKSKLEQGLAGFTTKEPKSRSLLIKEVREMLNARIDYNRDELGEKNLEQKVNISIEKRTSVEEVLKAILDSAGWNYVIEDEGLRVKPKPAGGPMS